MIATMRNLIYAQGQFQAAGHIDENGNGVGEYGSFAELSGAAPVRGGRAKIDRPLLSARFGNVEGHRFRSNDYYFMIYLPGTKGGMVSEGRRGGFRAGTVDAEAAERRWCCYAWPVVHGEFYRTFFVDQSGDILATHGYEGGNSPMPDAALVNRALAGELVTEGADCVADHTYGRDGRLWKQAG